MSDAPHREWIVPGYGQVCEFGVRQALFPGVGQIQENQPPPDLATRAPTFPAIWRTPRR